MFMIPRGLLCRLIYNVEVVHAEFVMNFLIDKLVLQVIFLEIFPRCLMVIPPRSKQRMGTSKA